MKKLLLVLSLVSINCFAADSITGVVLLKTKSLNVSVETNINTGRKIVLDQATYKIDRINASNIRASNSKGSVEVFLGETFKEDLLAMTKGQITDYFGLKNGKEINCSKTKSKAFIVYTTVKDGALGNCIN